MAEASIRDLRNQGGRVIDRVLAGERITVTRDGRPVAELHPVRNSQGASVESLIERFRTLPPLDPALLRADIDEIIDQSI